MYIHAILITYSFFQIPGKHFVFQTIVIAKEGIPVLIHLDKNILFFLIKSYEIQTLIFKKWVMVWCAPSSYGCTAEEHEKSA